MAIESRTRCENCGAPLSGGYCSRCGQSTTDYNVPLGEFAKEFVSESFDLDSRLRLTLRSLFLEPGVVPRDYVAGHRARFVPPVRLYLLASFAMFLLMSLGSGLSFEPTDTTGTVQSSFGEGAEAADPEVSNTPAAEPAPSGAGANAEDSTTDSAGQGQAKSLDERIEDRLVEGFARIADDEEAFTQDFVGRMARAMFFLLPLFALLLKILYRRRLYVHHLVFAIYLHSFVFLLMSVVMIPDALGLERVSNVASVALLWVPAYSFVGMRRFYEESRLKTFLKLAMLSFSYWVVGVLTLLLVLASSLLIA